MDNEHGLAAFKKRGGFGWSESHGVSPTLESEGGTHQGGPERIPYVMAHGQANAEIVKDGSPSLTLNHEAPIVTTFNGYTGGADDNDAQGGHLVMAFTERTRANGRSLEVQDDLAYALTNPGSGGRTHSRQIAGDFGVRRLTPVECERLQGFPDGHTAGQSDSARYRQMGNAVAVPVAEWIGRRIMEAS